MSFHDQAYYYFIAKGMRDYLLPVDEKPLVDLVNDVDDVNSSNSKDVALIELSDDENESDIQAVLKEFTASEVASAPMSSAESHFQAK